MLKRMLLKRRIKRALRKLGRNEMTVAVTLKTLGINGRRRQSNFCPVANYLKKEFPGERVSVGGNSLRVDGVSLDTPTPVKSFILSFDDGRYSELNAYAQGLPKN